MIKLTLSKNIVNELSSQFIGLASFVNTATNNHAGFKALTEKRKEKTTKSLGMSVEKYNEIFANNPKNSFVPTFKLPKSNKIFTFAQTDTEYSVEMSGDYLSDFTACVIKSLKKSTGSLLDLAVLANDFEQDLSSVLSKWKTPKEKKEEKVHIEIKEYFVIDPTKKDTTEMNKTAHDLLIETWETVEKIPFKVEWKNKTGYFDHLTTDDLNLEPGQIVGSTCDIGRKILIKCLAKGANHVVFERATNKKVVVSNEPRNKGVDIPLGFNSSLSANTMEVFLGLREPTHTFYEDEYAKIFVDGITEELKEKIKNGQPLTYSEIESQGVNPYCFDCYFHSRGYNL